MNDNVVPINGQFRFAEQEKVYWPVEVVQFGESPDDAERVQIQWLVSLLKRDSFERFEQLRSRGQKLAQRANRGEDITEEAMEVGRETAKIIEENVHGWRGIVDETGAEIKVTKANKQKLLENTRLFNSAMTALFTASSGALPKNWNAGAGG